MFEFFKSIFIGQVGSVTRKLLVALGAYLVTQNVINDEQAANLVEIVVSAVLNGAPLIAAFFWSWYRRRDQLEEPQ